MEEKKPGALELAMIADIARLRRDMRKVRRVAARSRNGGGSGCITMRALARFRKCA